MFKNYFICLFLLNCSLALADEMVPTVLIDTESQLKSPIEEYSTYKVEKVSKEKFKQAQRQTLSELVKDQVGVEAQTYCANCGAKRLTINGLKGEHTSILVDGLPLHSAISSFYGVDSIPVNGIEDIAVMRGTGASLSNPEAIGGSLDLLTVDPLIKKQIYSTSLSIDDFGNGTANNHSFLVSTANNEKNFGLSFGAQYTEQNTWDEDENGVAESPERDNISGLFKARYLPNAKNDLRFRLGVSDLTILGGPENPRKPDGVREISALETDFVDGNVEKDFIGDPLKITDWISLQRYEAAAHWTHFLSQKSTLNWNTGYAHQAQDAIYQHGFDYAHNDNLLVSDFSYETYLGDSHFFTVGLFHKSQFLRSQSDVLFGQLALPKDDFNHNSNAIYAQYTYMLSEKVEIDFALRLDQVYINWLDLSNEINEFVPAPRLQLRQDFTDHLSQRFSYGLGYRAPLTFFESQHGNQESGYVIDITDLEKAHSAVYSLSYNNPEYYITFGNHYVYLQNMAFGFESQGQPIFYRNTNEDYEIWAHDLLLGYQISPNWMLEASVEFFRYQDGYTKKLPTAAIERRYQLQSNYKTGNWTHNFAARIVGSRDLARYGRYPDHLVDRKQFPPPERRGDEVKDQKAPSFYILDTSISYLVAENYTFTFGISNLLNEIQVKYGDSPSMWHWHFDHAHYDGLHTWGPNRGREYFLSFQAEI